MKSQKASPYICTQCEFVGKYYMALRNHKEKVHGEVYRQFPLKTCEECDFSTRFQSKMKVHQLTEHTELKKCKFCPFETGYKKTLKRHKATEHQNKYDCHTCDFKTTSKAGISSHIQSHLPQTPQNVFLVCDKCGQSFMNEQNLKNHRIMSHKDTEIVPSMIPCDRCDLFLESDELLKIHRQRVHYKRKGITQKRCQYCNVPMKRVAQHEKSCVYKDKPKQMRDYQGSKLFQDNSFGWI